MNSVKKRAGGQRRMLARLASKEGILSSPSYSVEESEGIEKLLQRVIANEYILSSSQILEMAQEIFKEGSSNPLSDQIWKILYETVFGLTKVLDSYSYLSSYDLCYLRSAMSLLRTSCKWVLTQEEVLSLLRKCAHYPGEWLEEQRKFWEELGYEALDHRNTLN